ncbi:HelD family protein [Marininema halotolerans]|uniref:DNA helicase-2 / ATP-dependent DNA helicase PcrA n=1 Tax=Marininema halotolerans TaxID=1155944 RepID=A0A1I6R3M5_9BACL|nr:UvrD-helicase domain-containing protein [Marininema halotolerans]SFS59293.1 DNA helicase-2 / ATP-dependent DNA helicase PcrA [Marininema halotolerans]
MENEQQVEQQHLDKTITIIEKQIDMKSESCKRMATSPSEEQLLKQDYKTLDSLQKIRPNPYFGRLDFQDEWGQETVYIGKCGVAENDHLIIVDWRTDIGKLYNSYQGVKKDFLIGTDGKQSIEITRKRALVIQDDRIIKYTDVGKTEVVETETGEKVKMMDAYLEEILHETENELQLRDIISSIQEEQDEIIRLPLNNTIVVQGAAGSGKSSIALHRISYLLYQYQNELDRGNVLILAPNEMFLSYFRNLVPELDINGIEQRTFYDWASTYFTDVRSIPDLHQNYVEIYADQKKEERILISKYKGSLQFKKLLDKFVEEIGRKLLPYGDIHFSDQHMLTKESIVEFYESRSHMPFNDRFKEVKQYIQHWSKQEENAHERKVEEEFEEVYEKWIRPLPEGEDRKQIYTYLEQAKKIRLELFREQVKKTNDEYGRKMKSVSALRMYKSVFQKRIFNLWAPDMDEKLLGLLLENGKKIAKEQFSYEDIAPLIYLDAKINGKSLQYDHIVIDEAQDYSPFQLAIMQDYAKSTTILGDVAQGIFSHYGLDNWDEFQNYAEEKHPVQRINLQTSYRSTKEIMDIANRVLINNSYPYPLVIPVNRQGSHPTFEKVTHFGELCDRINESLDRILASGHQTIAILSKDAESATDLYHQLKQKGRKELELVMDPSHELQQRVIIIPSYLVKGLEFDAVIMEDVSDKVFEDQTHHAKMLYMSITRAHHELVLYYRGELSPLLTYRDPAEPPPPRPTFADWLITDYRDPSVLPQVESQREVKDPDAILLFEEEEEQLMTEYFDGDRNRVQDFYAWREIWKKWASEQGTQTVLNTLQ